MVPVRSPSLPRVSSHGLRPVAKDVVRALVAEGLPAEAAAPIGAYAEGHADLFAPQGAAGKDEVVKKGTDGLAHTLHFNTPTSFVVWQHDVINDEGKAKRVKSALYVRLEQQAGATTARAEKVAKLTTTLDDEDKVAAAEREALARRLLGDTTPHIAPTISTSRLTKKNGVEKEVAYQPLYERGDLITWLTSDPPPKLEVRRRVMLEVVRGVMEMHAKGLLHLDLKLENIVLRGEGDDVTADVTDFGLSAPFVDENGDPPRNARASHYYAPPDVCRYVRDFQDEPVRTVADDIYSLGLVLYGLEHARLPEHVPQADASGDLLPPADVAERLADVGLDEMAELGLLPQQAATGSVSRAIRWLFHPCPEERGSLDERLRGLEEAIANESGSGVVVGP
jgi:serine/threonine protein kinase